MGVLDDLENEFQKTSGPNGTSSIDELEAEFQAQSVPSPGIGRIAKKSGYAVTQGIADTMRGVSLGIEHSKGLAELNPEAALMSMAPSDRAEYGRIVNENPNVDPRSILSEMYNRRAEEGAKTVKAASETKALQMPEEYKQPAPGAGKVYQFAEDAVTGVAGSIPNMAMMAVPGGQLPGAIGMFERIRGGAYDKMVSEGSDPDVAFIASGLSSLAQTPIESAGNIIQLAGIKKAITSRGAQFLQKLIQNSVAEGFENALQAYPEKVAELYAKNNDMPTDELVKKIGSEITSGKFTKDVAYQFGTGAAGGGLMFGATAGPAAVLGERSDNVKKQPSQGQDGKPNPFMADLQSGAVTVEELRKLRDRVPEALKPDIDAALSQHQGQQKQSAFAFPEHTKADIDELEAEFQASERDAQEKGQRREQREALQPVLDADLANRQGNQQTMDAKNWIEHLNRSRESAPTTVERPVDVQRQQQEVELLTDILANSDDKAARQAIADEMKRRFKPAFVPSSSDPGSVPLPAPRPVTEQMPDAGRGTTLTPAEFSRQAEPAPSSTLAQPSPAVTPDLPQAGTGEGIPKNIVHDYSSTQINLPKSEADGIREFAANIPESEIYTELDDDSYGREKEPHVTVRYGLESVDPAEIAPAFKGLGPIKAKMGKVSIFETDKYDVVKVEIDSPELREANKRVGDTVDLPGETFKDYQPHATIAYVKKGEGKKYVGNKSFDGKEITVNEIVFSSKDGKMHPIKLEGEPPTKNPINSIGKSGRREVVVDPGGSESVTPDNRLKPLDTIEDRRGNGERRNAERKEADMPRSEAGKDAKPKIKYTKEMFPENYLKPAVAGIAQSQKTIYNMDADEIENHIGKTLKDIMVDVKYKHSRSGADVVTKQSARSAIDKIDEKTTILEAVIKCIGK